MIKRKILPVLEKALAMDKVMVITGMRRVGKTTLVRYMYDKISNRRKLYLDLENPLNQIYFSEVDYDKIKLHFERLAVGRGEDLIVFLDEIQNGRNIPSIVKYLYDHFGIKFVLTGSASFYLKNLFSESLAGRKTVFELFPLDFKEFLSYKAPNLKKPSLSEKISKASFHLFDTYFSEYLAYGGFPSVVLANTSEDKLMETEDIFTSYFQKEIQQLSDFRKLETMRSVILLLMRRVGSKIDVTKIAAEVGVSRMTVQEYVDFLEGTYLISKVRPYSKNVDVIIRGQPKVYVCDGGLLNKMGDVPQAVRLENTVFDLIRNYGEIWFYQTKAGAEIDFLIKKDRQLMAMEVKTQAHPSDVGRLRRLAGRLGIKDYFIVAQNFSLLDHVVYPFQL